MFGRFPRLPIDLLFDLDNSPQQGDYQDYVRTWQAGIKQAYDIASRNATKSSARSKAYYDKKASAAVLRPGDCVLLRNLSERGGPGKLCSYWKEQKYIVDEHVYDSPVYRVKPKHSRGKQRVLHRNLLHLSQIAQEICQKACNQDNNLHLNQKALVRVLMMNTRWTHRAAQPPPPRHGHPRGSNIGHPAYVSTRSIQ